MSAVLVVVEAAPTVELAVAAWLDSKGKLSGSKATLRSYRDILAGFRAALRSLGMDLDGDPRDVALVAQAWCSKDRRGVAEVGASTFNHRLAVLSSFYTFARKRQLVAMPSNPVDLIDRRKVQGYAGAVPLSAGRVAEVLRGIDRGTLAGMRDYALLSVALHTGRRVSELARLRLGEVEVAGDRVTLTWARAKGGKTMRDTLPAAVSAALLRYLERVYGADLTGLVAAEAPVWVSLSRNGSKGGAISTRAISDVCMKHLGTSKVHTLRHTFAHAMEEAGAKVSDIQARLGHGSLAVTGRYLAALRRADNQHGEALAAMFGMVADA